MKNTEKSLEKSRKLIASFEQYLNIARRVKAKALLNNDDFQIDYFDADFEHLHDMYQSRLQTNKMTGNYTDGLEELLQKMQQKRDFLPQIRLTSFRSEDTFMLFSDPAYTVCLGLLIFPTLPQQTAVNLPVSPTASPFRAMKTVLEVAFRELETLLPDLPADENKINNLFAGSVLLSRCLKGSVLYDYGQIELNAGFKINDKTLRFAAVIWEKPWNAYEKTEDIRPLAVLEWKVQKAGRKPKPAKKLQRLAEFYAGQKLLIFRITVKLSGEKKVSYDLISENF